MDHLTNIAVNYEFFLISHLNDNRKFSILSAAQKTIWPLQTPFPTYNVKSEES